MATTPAKPRIKPTEKILNLIVRRFAEGKTFASIERLRGYPAASTIRDWRREIPEFASGLARAREERGESLAEQALDLADNATTADISVRREQIRVRQWYAEKADPVRFGDRVTVDADVVTTVKLDLNEGARRIAFVLAKAARMGGGEPPAQLRLGVSEPVAEAKVTEVIDLNGAPVRTDRAAQVEAKGDQIEQQQIAREAAATVRSVFGHGAPFRRR